MKLKENWNTEWKCLPLSQEPVSVCLQVHPLHLRLPSSSSSSSSSCMLSLLPNKHNKLDMRWLWRKIYNSSTISVQNHYKNRSFNWQSSIHQHLVQSLHYSRRGHISKRSVISWGISRLLTTELGSHDGQIVTTGVTVKQDVDVCSQTAQTARTLKRGKKLDQAAMQKIQLHEQKLVWIDQTGPSLNSQSIRCVSGSPPTTLQ